MDPKAKDFNGDVEITLCDKSDKDCFVFTAHDRTETDKAPTTQAQTARTIAESIHAHMNQNKFEHGNDSL